MGWNFRKSIKVGKHTRINLSKSGIGVSSGVKGARVSVGPKGVRETVGIPGTGIYYTKQQSLNKLNDSKNPPTNNGYNRNANNKGKGGCGCLSVIAIIVILIAVIGNSTSNKNDSVSVNSTSKPKVETRVSKPSKADNTNVQKQVASEKSASSYVSAPASKSVSMQSQSNSSNNNSNRQNTQNTQPAVVQPAPKTQQASNQNNELIVYVTNTGKKYHMAGCRYLKRSQISIKLKDAKAEGYEPCSVCNPPQ